MAFAAEDAEVFERVAAGIESTSRTSESLRDLELPPKYQQRDVCKSQAVVDSDESLVGVGVVVVVAEARERAPFADGASTIAVLGWIYRIQACFSVTVVLRREFGTIARYTCMHLAVCASVVKA